MAICLEPVIGNVGIVAVYVGSAFLEKLLIWKSRQKILPKCWKMGWIWG